VASPRLRRTSSEPKPAGAIYCHKTIASSKQVRISILGSGASAGWRVVGTSGSTGWVQRHSGVTVATASQAETSTSWAFGTNKPR
jgi:hypothetical protein